MEIAKLALLMLASLCGFGALLGGASSVLCPEAFTIAHPPSFEHWPALALGAMWGALDLLFPAAFTGVALGLAANFGPRPALKAAFFRRMIPGLLAIMAAASLLAGTAGFFLTRSGVHGITGPMKTAIAVERHPMFAAVWWASLGSLLVLFASALILAVWTWRKRAFYEELLRKR